jgi:DNA-binding NtrC family response regulator
MGSVLMPGKSKILIADDEDYIRKLSTRILTLEGYEILQADNGEKAIEIYKDNKENIELVVLDIRMPGRSGVDVLHQLISINPHVRAILCSGYGEYELTPDSGYFFIQKPFSVNSLLEAVYKVLNTSKEEIAKNNEKAKNFIFLEE